MYVESVASWCCEGDDAIVVSIPVGHHLIVHNTPVRETVTPIMGVTKNLKSEKGRP